MVQDITRSGYVARCIADLSCAGVSTYQATVDVDGERFDLKLNADE